ncbi:MAG TPA: gluconokinase [Bacteroidota bacterium]
MILIVMGVSGSGKTTVGKMLAQEMGWPFYEGDDLHPQANIEKMARGTHLDDTDREPWIRSLRGLIRTLTGQSQNAVVACSALKERHRQVLLKETRNLRFVYLKGEVNLIEERLKERKSHFMKATLLKSQFDTLEEPDGAIVVDVRQEPAVIVARINAELAKSD